MGVRGTESKLHERNGASIGIVFMQLNTGDVHYEDGMLSMQKERMPHPN